MTARADLHVHSRHSDRPSEWILRRLGSPESFTDPRELYRLCRARGMRFVTISDHDEIAGALEIAHLPGTFVSCEVTAAFPEDGCQIHLLVAGIDEAGHREIQRLRGNLYELRDWLLDRGVVHSVAHPLYRVNDLLTVDHVERLLVLFKRFEARNGIHDGRSNRVVETLFAGLTSEVVADLAEHHRLDPRDPEPWVKHFTGGSDDHGGFYPATTWTETPEAATIGEFLDHLRAVWVRSEAYRLALLAEGIDPAAVAVLPAAVDGEAGGWDRVVEALWPEAARAAAPTPSPAWPAARVAVAGA